MAKTNSKQDVLIRKRLAALAVRYRRTATALQSNIEDISWAMFIKPECGKPKCQVKEAITRRAECIDFVANTLVKNLGRTSYSIDQTEVLDFEDTACIVEMRYVIAEVVSVPQFAIMWKKKEEDFDQNRKFCLEHLKSAKQCLRALETFRDNKRLGAEKPEMNDTFKNDINAILQLLNTCINRAAMELGKPAFRMGRESLGTWHDELKAVAYKMLMFQEISSKFSREMDAKDARAAQSPTSTKTQDGATAAPASPERDATTIAPNDRPARSPRERYADCIKGYCEVATTMNACISDLRASLRFKKMEELVENIGVNLYSLNRPPAQRLM